MKNQNQTVVLNPTKIEACELIIKISNVYIHMYKQFTDSDKEITFILFKSIFHISEHEFFEDVWNDRNINSSIGLYRDDILIGLTLVIKNELKYIAVQKSLQVEGLGTALLKETINRTLISRVKSLILYPAESDYLINWYISNGFRILSKKDNLVKMMYTHHNFKKCIKI